MQSEYKIGKLYTLETYRINIFGIEEIYTTVLFLGITDDEYYVLLMPDGRIKIVSLWKYNLFEIRGANYDT